MSESVKIPRAAGESPRIVRRSEWSTQPWKNGKGVTHEIVRWVDPARAHSDASAFDLRVSVAEIEGAQPFSVFPGIERVLVPLEDNDLVLALYAVEEPMTRHRILRFSGEVLAATKGEGRATDLNVMWPRGRDVRVEVGRSESSPDRRALAVFALEQATLRDAAGNETRLDPHDLVVGGRAFFASAPMVWIRF